MNKPYNPRRVNECLQAPVRTLAETIAQLCDDDLLCLTEREFRASARQLVLAEAGRRRLLERAEHRRRFEVLRLVDHEVYASAHQRMIAEARQSGRFQALPPLCPRPDTAAVEAGWR